MIWLEKKVLAYIVEFCAVKKQKSGFLFLLKVKECFVQIAKCMIVPNHSHQLKSSETCFLMFNTNQILSIYLFIYFQFNYRWQILFHLTIRLAFHKQQGLSQTSGAINNIAECCYRWHQIFETEPQFVVL